MAASIETPVVVLASSSVRYFIRQLAEYERLASKVVASEALLRESLFGKQPKAEVLIAYFEKEPAGFAVFFHNFSTFAARATPAKSFE